MAVARPQLSSGNNSCSEFTNNELGPQTFAGLNAMRLARKYVDIILRVGEREIPAHRVILAASCPYFDAMLEDRKCGFLERESLEIPIFGVDPESVETVVEYFYTSRIKLDISSVEKVFEVASLWQVNFVLEACEEFFCSHMSHGNCLGLRSLMLQHGLTKTLEMANNHVFSNFKEVCEEEEFLSLPVDQLQELIQSDNLQTSEEIIFDALMRWMNEDFLDREKHLADLLASIRWTYFPEGYLAHFLSSQEKVRSDSLRPYLSSFLSAQSSAKQLSSSKPRNFEALYVFGGKYNAMRTTVGAVSCINTALGLPDKTEERLSHNPNDPHPFHAVVINGDIFLISYKVFKFDHGTASWREIYSTPENLKVLDVVNAGLCVQDGMVYAIGGVSGACRFDPNATSLGWVQLPHMIVERYRTGTASLRGYIYAIGGCGKTYYESKSVSERFNPAEDKWKIISEMKFARWSPQVVVHNDKLFSIGGYDTDVRSKVGHVEVFDPDTEEWSSMPPLNVPRRWFGATVVNGIIYVAGGFDACSVEYFDEGSNGWRLLLNANVDRFECSCVSLPVPWLLFKGQSMG